MEFREEMELLEGRALYVPELGSVVGFTPGDRLLCAYGFDERGVPRWRRTWREGILWECYYDGKTPSREMVGLAYLGKGSVDANFGQHTRALECAGRKQTEGQRGHADRSDRLNKPVRPVSRVLPGSVVSSDNYHTYAVKDGEVYEQTSKG